MSEDIKEILDKLEIVARKHTIEVCEDSSKIETMPACLVHELRLYNYSAKTLLDYITNLQEEYKEIEKSLNKECEEKDKEIQRLNNIIKHTDSWIDRTIEIIKQQPSGNDEWILERLNSIKQCLKDSDK